MMVIKDLVPDGKISYQVAFEGYVYDGLFDHGLFSLVSKYIS